MAEEQTVESKARNLGWVPQEEFRGRSEEWLAAEDFVERGEKIMPILKENNRALQDQVSGLRGELGKMQTTLQAAQQSVQDLKDMQAEITKGEVDRLRAELLRDIKLAKKDGDVDAEVDLQEALRDLDKKVVAPSPPPAATPPAPAQVDPAFATWQGSNPWFGVDKRKTALMVTIGQELRSDPANAGLVGLAFYQKAASEVEAILGGGSGRPLSKVDGGGGAGGAGGSGGSGGGKGYAALPAEAKVVCDQRSDRFVGPTKAFKTKAEWQAHYAQVFFAAQGEN